jgi:hypothetical protein
MPHVRQEERSACGHEAKEEDDYSKVLLVHEMVSQARGTICDPSTGELNIECAECRRYAVNKESVQEAYGSVSAEISIGSASDFQRIPESWQTSEESYKRHQRHCQGEDDDSACERHGEGVWGVLVPMRCIVVDNGRVRFLMFTLRTMRHSSSCVR